MNDLVRALVYLPCSDKEFERFIKLLAACSPGLRKLHHRRRESHLGGLLAEARSFRISSQRHCDPTSYECEQIRRLDRPVAVTHLQILVLVKEIAFTTGSYKSTETGCELVGDAPVDISCGMVREEDCDDPKRGRRKSAHRNVMLSFPDPSLVVYRPIWQGKKSLSWRLRYSI